VVQRIVATSATHDHFHKLLDSFGDEFLDSRRPNTMTQQLRLVEIRRMFDENYGLDERSSVLATPHHPD
jgi:hypothetical protein